MSKKSAYLLALLAFLVGFGAGAGVVAKGCPPVPVPAADPLDNPAKPVAPAEPVQAPAPAPAPVVAPAPEAAPVSK